MGHAPKNLSRPQHHDRVDEPTPRTRAHDAGVSIDKIVRVGTGTNTNKLGILANDRLIFYGMKSALIYQQDEFAGRLEVRDDSTCRFTYEPGYHGEPVSLTMPVQQQVWDFPKFPAPFEGLLPEGTQLDALLRVRKLDRNDLFGQLLAVGGDVVGSLRIEEAG